MEAPGDRGSWELKDLAPYTHDLQACSSRRHPYDGTAARYRAGSELMLCLAHINAKMTAVEANLSRIEARMKMLNIPY